MAITAPARRREQQQRSTGGGGLLLLGGLGAALAGVLIYEHEKGSGSGSAPTSDCPGCAAGAPALAPGLYETCSVPGNPSSCTIWRVAADPTGKMVRYGYTTPKQLARCEGATPHVVTSGFGFGNGDTASFIGTVQDISAGCPCPPGALNP